MVTKIEKGQRERMAMRHPLSTMNKMVKVCIASLFVLFFAIPFAHAQCIAPFDGMVLSSSRMLCQGEFEAENMRIEGMGTVIECDSTILIGDGDNAGFLVWYAQNPTIRGCTFQNYEAGISVKGTVNAVIESNTFLGNKIGIGEEGSSSIQRNNVFEGSIRQDVLSIESTQSQEQGESEPQVTAITPAIILRKQIVLKNPDADEEEIREQVNALLEEAELSQEMLDIQRTIAVDEWTNTTTITLSITPRYPIEDARIYESIPKCLAEYVSQAVFSDDGFEVIEEDPLIMWSFSELDEKTRLSYSVGKKVSQECLDLLLGFGIATRSLRVQKVEKDVPEKTNGSSVAFGILMLLFAVTIIHRVLSKKTMKPVRSFDDRS